MLLGDEKVGVTLGGCYQACGKVGSRSEVAVDGLRGGFAHGLEMGV